MSQQNSERKKEHGKKAHLDLIAAVKTSKLESVKKVIESLRPQENEKFDAEKYRSRRDKLIGGLYQGIEMCAEESIEENERWQITLHIFQELIKYFPSFVALYIKDEKQQVTDPYKHSKLSYDLVPSNVSSLPDYNPLSALWQSIFLHFLPACTEYPETFQSRCFLATTFRGMGWGRNLAISNTPKETEKYFRDLSPEISGAMDDLIKEKSKDKLNEMLSQLVKALSSGKSIDDTYIRGVDELLKKHTPLPEVLLTEISEYAGFFSHHRAKIAPEGMISEVEEDTTMTTPKQ